MRTTWWWLTAGIVLTTAVGAALFVGRWTAHTPSDRTLDLTPPTRYERELQQINMIALAGRLAEATLTPQGWIVRFEEDANMLAEDELLKQARVFLRDLHRLDVDVLAVSYEAQTNDLQDVWGNALNNVPVFKLALNQTTFNRVNWTSFAPENFQRIADEFWIHPAASGAVDDGSNKEGAPEEESTDEVRMNPEEGVG